MRENMFADNFDGPLVGYEEWMPLNTDNLNAPIGVNLPSFAERRGVQFAVQMFSFQRKDAAKAAEFCVGGRG